MEQIPHNKLKAGQKVWVKDYSETPYMPVDHIEYYGKKPFFRAKIVESRHLPGTYVWDVIWWRWALGRVIWRLRKLLPNKGVKGE